MKVGVWDFTSFSRISKNIILFFIMELVMFILREVAYNRYNYKHKHYQF